MKVFSFILFIFLFVSCSDYYADMEFKPVIHDENKVLKPATIDSLKKLNYPKSLVFVVRVVDSVGQNEIKSSAADFYSKDYDQHYDPVSFYDRAVYFFVTQKPALVQIRTGYELKQLASWNGISNGTRYIARQKIARQGNIDKALLSMVNFAADSIPKAVNLSVVKKYIYDKFNAFGAVSSGIESLLDAARISQSSYYVGYLLKPSIELRIKTGSNWLTYVLLFLAAHLLIFFIRLVFVKGLFRKLKDSINNTFMYIVSFVVHLCMLVPAINATTILEGGRLEDRMALSEMNLKGFAGFEFHPEAYNAATVWWLALLIVVVYFLKNLIKIMEYSEKSDLPPQKQLNLYMDYKMDNPLEARINEFGLMIKNRRRIKQDLEYGAYSFLSQDAFITLFFGGIFTGLSCWLFLPFSVSLALFYFLLISFIFEFFKSIGKEVSENQNSAKA